MVFAAGAGECCAQFTVAKCAAKCRDSANDPKHDQCETGLYVGELKPQTGEHTCADDICDHNSAGGKKTDGSSWSLRIRYGRFRRSVHFGIDPLKDGFAAANNGIVRRIRQLIDDLGCQTCRIASF